MRTGTLLAMTVLVISTACNSRQAEQRIAAAPTKNTLTSVVNSASIEGPPEAVFDLVTTARFWPQWHPATTAVSGVTERPFLLADRIVERGHIGQGNFEVTWRVAEHVRPRRVVLQSESSPVQIIYSFNARENVTEYMRELKYNVEDLTSISPDPNEVNRLMQLQSEQAVKQLKALVEKILRAEKIQSR